VLPEGVLSQKCFLYRVTSFLWAKSDACKAKYLTLLRDHPVIGGGWAALFALYRPCVDDNLRQRVKDCFGGTLKETRGTARAPRFFRCNDLRFNESRRHQNALMLMAKWIP
jgi:hypothetical protein